MASALLVSLLGISALALVRVDHLAARKGHEIHRARRYAQAAVEMGMLRIESDPNWRTVYPNGVWEANQPIGEGSYTLEGIDPGDGDLTNSATDSVVLTGTGTKGSAVQKVAVTLSAISEALSSLGTAIHAGGDITNNTLQSLTASGAPVSSNAAFDNLLGIVNADVEALSVSGTINGLITAPAPAKDMPPSTVFDYYTSGGTPISIADIPTVDGTKTIQYAVISPNANPFGTGATNAEGIYVIDCQTQVLSIQDSRIVGTLVLLNAGAGTAVGGSVNWSPAVSNYPSLLVDGDCDLVYGASELAESRQTNNYNPPGTPYEGIEDTDYKDSYPSLINGLIYASGNATTQNDVTLAGVFIVGGTYDNLGNVTVNYDSTFLANPPPGFSLLRMLVSPGTWRKAVN